MDKYEREIDKRELAAAYKYKPKHLLQACKWLFDQWLQYADQRYLTEEEKKHKAEVIAAIAKAEKGE